MHLIILPPKVFFICKQYIAQLLVYESNLYMLLIDYERLNLFTVCGLRGTEVQGRGEFRESWKQFPIWWYFPIGHVFCKHSVRQCKCVFTFKSKVLFPEVAIMSLGLQNDDDLMYSMNFKWTRYCREQVINFWYLMFLTQFNC